MSIALSMTFFKQKIEKGVLKLPQSSLGEVLGCFDMRYATGVQHRKS
jgi:hypothetical protein